MTWRRAPIGPSSLCWPIRVFPQIWWSTEVLSSRTDSGNFLLSSLNLNRILRTHIQKLVYMCERANLSRNSLFVYVFIDLRTFENSASLSEGLRQPSHYSWIGRRQCYLGWFDILISSPFMYAWRDTLTYLMLRFLTFGNSRSYDRTCYIYVSCLTVPEMLCETTHTMQCDS